MIVPADLSVPPEDASFYARPGGIIYIDREQQRRNRLRAIKSALNSIELELMELEEQPRSTYRSEK